MGKGGLWFFFSPFCKSPHPHMGPWGEAAAPRGAGQGSHSAGRPLSPIPFPPRGTQNSFPGSTRCPRLRSCLSLTPLLPTPLRASAIAHRLTRSEQASSVAPRAKPVSPPHHPRSSGRIWAGCTPPLPPFSFRSCFTPAIASLRLRNGHVGDALPTTKLSRSSPQSSQKKKTTQTPEKTLQHLLVGQKWKNNNQMFLPSRPAS